MIGESAAAQKLKCELSYAAQSNQAVLLNGETGTGKGLCAQVIHELSPRKARALVRYQPLYSSPDLVNSDLFGHLQGAFTGAAENREGLLNEAQGGTLFLDEIDELPPTTQVTLLGVLQDRRYRPLGSNKEQAADFRLICASNQNLEHCVQSGKLRVDLYHRLAHLQIQILPLRERLAALEQAIAGQEAEKAELTARLDDPATFGAHDTARVVLARFAETEALLEAAYREWHDLAEQIEAIEAEADA